MFSLAPQTTRFAILLLNLIANIHNYKRILFFPLVLPITSARFRSFFSSPLVVILDKDLSFTKRLGLSFCLSKIRCRYSYEKNGKFNDIHWKIRFICSFFLFRVYYDCVIICFARYVYAVAQQQTESIIHTIDRF